jgi:hypothetical protein
VSDKPKSRWANLASPEMLAALSAVVIGACALVVAFFEVRIMRADQRASVLPMMEINRSTLRSVRDAIGEDETVTQLTFTAENVGIGPARVVDFHLLVDGRPINTWGDAVRELLGRDESIKYSNSTIMGRIIPAGRSINMFSMTGTELAGDVNANIDRLEIEACYCSVFNECWTVNNQDFDTISEVASCKPDADSFQE